MAVEVTYSPSPPEAADLESLDYCRWKWRQRAGISQQVDSGGAWDDAAVDDLLTQTSIVFGGTTYYQPLIALAWFLRSDPEQRTESTEGDAEDRWVDPLVRADNLEREQELWNRKIIPDYAATSSPYLGPILTNWVSDAT